ncbi:hypothetical protein [uncultured Anaerococcus sp.]|uniref:hypothetical protein n=1 Tax=uncultured Anaerococcus sp. TaxID=293428 RepID=UPI002804431C|nr:hypothetical protein [uncultured Anaerococcus sp.]
MKLVAVNSVIAILFLVLPLIGQILICKYIRGRAGLILPGISFIISIIYMLNIPDIDGNVWPSVLTTLIIANIPTIIFYLIYRYYNQKEKQKDELDKMEIMDM